MLHNGRKGRLILERRNIVLIPFFSLFFRNGLLHFSPDSPVYGVTESVHNAQDEAEKHDDHNGNILKFPEEKIDGSLVAYVEDNYCCQND